jgi:hypothetical protein
MREIDLEDIGITLTDAQKRELAERRNRRVASTQGELVEKIQLLAGKIDSIEKTVSGHGEVIEKIEESIRVGKLLKSIWKVAAYAVSVAVAVFIFVKQYKLFG